MNPGRRYYQQELVRLTGDSLRPVQLALEKLERASLITRQQEGRRVYYQAVATHPAFGDLQSLFAKTFALTDVLVEALALYLSALRCRRHLRRPLHRPGTGRTEDLAGG